MLPSKCFFNVISLTSQMPPRWHEGHIEHILLAFLLFCWRCHESRVFWKHLPRYCKRRKEWHLRLSYVLYAFLPWQSVDEEGYWLGKYFLVEFLLVSTSPTVVLSPHFFLPLPSFLLLLLSLHLYLSFLPQIGLLLLHPPLVLSSGF